MDKLDRLYLLHRILASRRTPIAREDLPARLGCSRATLTRVIQTYRDVLHAPLEWDSEARPAWARGLKHALSAQDYAGLSCAETNVLPAEKRTAPCFSVAPCGAGSNT